MPVPSRLSLLPYVSDKDCSSTSVCLTVYSLSPQVSIAVCPLILSWSAWLSLSLSGLFGFGGDDEGGDDDATVVKLHVALFGDIRKYQVTMDKISDTYDTDDEDSLHGLLTATISWLLRNTEYCAYAGVRVGGRGEGGRPTALCICRCGGGWGGPGGGRGGPAAYCIWGGVWGGIPGGGRGGLWHCAYAGVCLCVGQGGGGQGAPQCCAYVCACVRACVRAGGWVCVWVCGCDITHECMHARVCVCVCVCVA